MHFVSLYDGESSDDGDGDEGGGGASRRRMVTFVRDILVMVIL